MNIAPEGRSVYNNGVESSQKLRRGGLVYAFRKQSGCVFDVEHFERAVIVTYNRMNRSAEDVIRIIRKQHIFRFSVDNTLSYS